MDVSINMVVVTLQHPDYKTTYNSHEIGVKHHTSRQRCTDWFYVTPIVSISHILGTVDDIPDRRCLACSDDTVPQWERAMTPPPRTYTHPT